MTINILKNHGGKIILGVALLGLLVALMTTHPGIDWVTPTAVSAQAAVLGPWTAIGASGTVDESSICCFGFTGPSAGYAAASTSINPLEFRYNVTNTFDNSPLGPNIPGWTTLELGGVAPGGSSINAILYRVSRCTGQQAIICRTRIAQSTTGVCKTCTFANTAINFTTDLYYVDVQVARVATAEVPLVHNLRIF